MFIRNRGKVDTWADYIFQGDQEGYVALTLITPAGVVRNTFLKWPEDREKILKAKANGNNLYFCPSLLKKQSRKKPDVLGSWVSWADCDKDSIESIDIPEAGLIIASGSGDNTHRYWRADEFAAAPLIEERNAYLREHLSADPSGIDATQLLRVPNSYNHKGNSPAPVRVRAFPGGTFDIPVRTAPQTQRLDYELLPLGIVLANNPLRGRAQSLFVKGAQDRSAGLYRLGAELREAGLGADEIYTLLHDANSRWGKFSQRDDSDIRIGEIVARTSQSVSFDLPEEEAPKKKRRTLSDVLSLRELVARPKVEVQWLYEGILRDRGFVVVSGRQGVGKSLFCLQWMCHILLGKAFLNRDYRGPLDQTILYASHEMDDAELFQFLGKQMEGLGDGAEEEIADRLRLSIRTENALHLDTEKVQGYYERLIADGVNGLIIDSLSASVSTSLKDDVVVRKIFDWIDSIRQKYGIWVMLITHPRKQPPGAKNYETTTDDVYGDSIITQRPSTVLNLKKHGRNQVQLQYLKARLTGTDDVVYLDRDTNLLYHVGEAKIEETPRSTKRRKDVDARNMGEDFDDLTRNVDDED